MTTAAYGFLTWYTFTSGVLFCDFAYTTAHDWIAVPVEHYQSGEVQCGDLYAVWSDGRLLWLPALDAGPFAAFCVIDEEECPSIVADLPRHVYEWDGLSTRGYVVNSEPWRERLEVER